MNWRLKKITSLLLVFTMTFNLMATPAFAWGWLNNAIDDVSDAVSDTVDDVGDWTGNAVEDVGDWTEGAADDVVDWTEGAVEDAGDWTVGAIKDSSHWLNHASDDVVGWVKTASEDTVDWLEVAVGDVGEFLEDVVQGIKNYRRAEKPKINGLYDDISLVVPSVELDKSYVNVLNESIGTFSEMINVKEKQLPQVTQDRIKEKLKNLGLSDYWAQFAVNKVSGASEGTSVGQIIESVIPFDFILNGMVADEIDAIVAREGFEDVDKTSTVQPASNIGDLEFKFSVDQLAEVSGPSTVMFMGITSIGYRDKVTAKFIAGGVEYPAKAFVDNNKVGFYAKVEDVSNLSFVLENDFEAPANVPLEIADGIQDTVNDLSPFGSPISNQAKRDIAEWLGDTEGVYEQSKTDKKTGNKTKEVKKMPSLNEFYAAGDAGVIVSNLIYNIPLIGDVLALIFKSTGNDETFANIIRDVVNQKEVKTFLKIENPQLLIQRDLFDYTDEALSNFEASVDDKSYTKLAYYGTNAQQMINVDGSLLKLPLENDRLSNYQGQLALVADENGNLLRAAAESTFEITFNAKEYKFGEQVIDYGNANLIFGVQNASLGNDQYVGQDIGFSIADDTLFYGLAQYNWTHKASRSAFTLGENHVLKVSVVREGNYYRAHVWLDGIAHGSFKLENYTPGMFGVRTWETDLSVSSIKVTTNEPTPVVSGPDQSNGASPTPTPEVETGLVTEIISEEFNKSVAFNTFDGSFSYNRAYDHSIYGKPTNGPDSLMTFDNKTLANGTLETGLTLYDPIAAHANGGLAFRVTNAGAGSNNYQGYYAGIKVASAGNKGKVVIGKMDNGKWTSLKEVSGNYTSRNLYDFKVVLDGSNIKVIVDGVEKISITDDTYSSGSFGFRSYQIPMIYTHITANSSN